MDPTNGVFNVAGWGIKLLRKDGTVARQGVTDAKGQIRFDGLPLGPYIWSKRIAPVGIRAATEL